MRQLQRRVGEGGREDRGGQGVPGRFPRMPVTHPQLSPLFCVGWGQRPRGEEKKDSGKEEWSQRLTWRVREGGPQTHPRPGLVFPGRPHALFTGNTAYRHQTPEVSATQEQLRLRELATPPETSRRAGAETQAVPPRPHPRARAPFQKRRKVARVGGPSRFYRGSLTGSLLRGESRS